VRRVYSASGNNIRRLPLVAARMALNVVRAYFPTCSMVDATSASNIE
jgi:hypothetical protein